MYLLEKLTFWPLTSLLGKRWLLLSAGPKLYPVALAWLIHLGVNVKDLESLWSILLTFLNKYVPWMPRYIQLTLELY